MHVSICVCMYVCMYVLILYVLLYFPGIILHYDTPDLSDYYFIDPHWLYHVFCQVCTPSVLNGNNINCE